MKKRIFLIVFTLIYLSFLLISCSNKGSENAINFDGKSFYEKPQIIRKIKMDGYTTDLFFGWSMPLFYKNIMILLVDYNFTYKDKNNSELQAIDINTNKIIWKNNNFYFYGHYYLYDNKLYISIGRTIESLCNIVWCINPEDGKIIWETEIKETETELYDMVFYKNNIIICADNGKIYFLDKDNGKVIKEREFIFKNRENLSEMWTEYPVYYIMTMALSKDILVLNSAAYGYIGYDIAKDKILWIYTVENTRDSYCISPAVDEDSAYLYIEKFYVCVDLISGKEKWKIDGKYSYSPCVVDEEKVYLESYGGITAINKKTGEKIWECRVKVDKKYIFGSTYYIYKYGNIIYYPLDYFYAIDAASGKILWKDKFDFKFFCSNDPKDKHLKMYQYITGIGIYKRKMYLVSNNNRGERFAWLYILGYKDKNKK